MDVTSRGALQRAAIQLAPLVLTVWVTTGCGTSQDGGRKGGGNGGGNPVTPTPTPAAGFYRQLAHLPRFTSRAGRSPSLSGSVRGGMAKQAQDQSQAAEFALTQILTLFNAAGASLQNCPMLTGQIFCPINTRESCEAGGRVEVHGNWSGSINDDGTGVLLLDSNETLTDCGFNNGVLVNGDPYLSLTASVNADGSGTFRVGGGFKWLDQDRSMGSCQVDLTLILDAAGGENGSGTVCGIDSKNLGL